MPHEESIEEMLQWIERELDKKIKCLQATTDEVPKSRVPSELEELELENKKFNNNFQEMIAETKKVMETQQDKKASNESPMEKDQKAPAPILIISPSATPTKTPVKAPNIESAIVTPEVKPPNTKPPKKPPPDSKYNNHAGGQRVRVGAADSKPGQHRNKVRWKDAAPAQRVSGRENYDKKKKDAALIQRVPGQQKQREHNDLQEGVLDTLQVSMHPSVGTDTCSRTIMVPVIGY